MVGVKHNERISYERKPEKREQKNVRSSTQGVRRHREMLSKSDRLVVSSKTEARKAIKQRRLRKKVFALPKSLQHPPEVGKRCTFVSHNKTATFLQSGKLVRIDNCNRNSKHGKVWYVVERDRRDRLRDRRLSQFISVPEGSCFTCVRLPKYRPRCRSRCPLLF